MKTTSTSLLLASAAGLLALTLAGGCRNTSEADAACPIPGGRLANELIQPGETHFKNLWMLTDGGENAEAYWSFASDRLVLQARNEDEGVMCDRIYVTDPRGGKPTQVSSGRGTTTCSYFLPDDKRVLFASTQSHHADCPPKPDKSRGYVWALYPEYDVYVRDLETGAEELLIGGHGYDAEATVSPTGDRIVFTSTRSGDIELWTCDLDGGDLTQVTTREGYDGGAFFSHDGEWLVYRTTSFELTAEEAEAARAELGPGETLDLEADAQRRLEQYREDLGLWVVRPNKMEIWVVRRDGTDARQVTNLGKASFAPFFFPDDSRILFSSNHHGDKEGLPYNFDLFAIDFEGGEPERITTFEGFDSFPMFSPDGKYLAFASNRGNSKPGDTNLFIAEWR